MIGFMFFVVGVILVIIGVRMNFSNLDTQLKSGKSLSQATSGTSAGGIIQYVGYACFLIAILYGFGILGGSAQPQPMVAGRRRRH
jgi:hypothetical protein